MTTFPPLPGSNNRVAGSQGLRSERYAFQVGGKDYKLQFCPMTCLEGYTDRQLAALEASAIYEVSFRLEAHVLPDGTVLAGYEVTGTGTAFQVLGGVANGIVAWAQQRQPDYLYWQAHGTGRQRLYDRIIRCFVARGSGWHRLPMDPFTRLGCEPDMFWLTHTSHDPVPHPGAFFHACRSPVS